MENTTHVSNRIASESNGSAITRLLRRHGLYRIESLIVVLAVVIGTLGSFLQHANQVSFENRIHEQYRVVEVLASSTKLASGTVLQREHFTVSRVLSGSKTDNMLTEDDLKSVLGKPLQLALAKGDVILLSMVGSGRGDDSVAAKIPEGKRLYTMLVDDPVAQSGFVKPGDFVDVLARMEFPGKGVTAFTLLSKIQLTAVGKSVDALKGVEATQISFVVTPGQMELLKFAEETGKFSVSLRNPLDAAEVKTGKGIDMQTFLSSDLVYTQAEQPVQVIQGDQGAGGKN